MKASSQSIAHERRAISRVCSLYKHTAHTQTKKLGGPDFTSDNWPPTPRGKVRASVEEEAEAPRKHKRDSSGTRTAHSLN